jgi:hypothetical protein
MTTLGRAGQRVRKDWATQFPALSIWRPRWLVRRLGPLLQGVHLDRASSPDVYRPTSHVHALVRPAPNITLTLARRLKTASGAEESISLRFHDKKYKEAARRLAQQNPLQLDRPPILSEVLAAYHAEVLETKRPAWAPSLLELEGMILLAGAVGNRSAIDSGLEFARSVSANWEADWPERSGRRQDWLDHLAEQARDQATLRRVVESEVERHGLRDVATYEMSTD